MYYNVGDKIRIATGLEHQGGHSGQCEHNLNYMRSGEIATIVGKSNCGTYYTYIVRYADGYQNSWNHTSCCFVAIDSKVKKIFKDIDKKADTFSVKPRKIAKIPYKSFKLGIELETLVDYDNEERISTAITGQGLPFIWEGDGSIETGNEDILDREFKGSKPMSYTELKQYTRKLLTILNDNEVSVNSSCGFHLHVSNKRFFNERVMNRIIYTWSAIEDFLLATQPRSRLNNSYCKRYLLEYITHEKNGRKLLKGKQNLITQLQGERYRTLNLTSLAKHGTIEIRLHAGTTQYKKVIAWVDLMLAFFTYCLKDYKHTEVTNLFYQKISEQKIDNICNLLGLPDKDSMYFKGRIHKMLFDRLAKQQESAGKIIKNIKTIQKARERADKAQAKFKEIDSAYQQEFRTLQAV